MKQMIVLLLVTIVVYGNVMISTNSNVCSVTGFNKYRCMKIIKFKTVRLGAGSTKFKFAFPYGIDFSKIR